MRHVSIPGIHFCECHWRGGSPTYKQLEELEGPQSGSGVKFLLQKNFTNISVGWHIAPIDPWIDRCNFHPFSLRQLSTQLLKRHWAEPRLPVLDKFVTAVINKKSRRAVNYNQDVMKSDSLFESVVEGQENRGSNYCVVLIQKIKFSSTVMGGQYTTLRKPIPYEQTFSRGTH